MANPEHVALVRKGTKAIAKWRQAHPKERLDLSDADLSSADLGGANLGGASLGGANLSGAMLGGASLGGANLSEANLSRGNLYGADLGAADLSSATLSEANLSWARFWETNLSRANLREADLSWADLWRVNLIGADLSRAKLTEADIWEADLRGADLRAADLSKAYLTRTNVSKAGFSQARFGHTSLSDVDLSDAEGLVTVNHSNASSVGMDTLIRSVLAVGNTLTPDLTTFFRGAGVPQEVLDVLPGAVAGINYASCFISYGQPDVEFAEKLTEGLRARGVPCWLWQRDKTVGKATWGEIEQKLDEYERMVVVCSIKALIRDGFKKEIDKQIDKNPDKAIPVSLDDDWKQDGFKAEWAGRDLKTWLLDRNYADFANKPYDEALDELLKGLRRPEVKKTRPRKKPS